MTTDDVLYTGPAYPVPEDSDPWIDPDGYDNDSEDPFADLESGEYERDMFADSAEDYARDH